MPDPSAIAGTPLPAPELPDATVTVRVVRERMGNNVAGQAVTLTIGKDKRTVKTDAQGRAQFDGLTAGVTVQATTTVDGETLTSPGIRGAWQGRRPSGADRRHRRRESGGEVGGGSRRRRSRRGRASSRSGPSRASSSSIRTTT